MSALVCSRRVAAGITPAPGSTSRLPVWWGRADWLQVDVAGALAEAPEVCREHHVSPDAVLAVARAMAAFADSRTGRDCRPTNERIVEVARCSLSTVQRARRVLKALGLIVEVVAGRTNMTLEQRLAAHGRGSSHRSIAAEFVLCSRRARNPQAYPRADLRVVGRDTPPVGKVVRGESPERATRLQSGTATKSTASRRAHTEKGRCAPAGGPDPRPGRLAQAVRRRLEWLRGVPAARMVPTLTRFALEGWSGLDVELTVRNELAARGMVAPRRFRTTPAAYLAWVLRDVDPADRPTAAEEWACSGSDP